MANDFFKHSSLYFLAEAFNKGLVFFTLPIFTYLLTPSEFGIISIYTTIMGTLIVLMSLSSHQSIIRNFHNSDVVFNEFLGALLPFILLFSASLVGLVYFFALDLAILLSVESSVLVFATLVAFFGVFLQLELSYMLASKNSKVYTKILVLRNILILSFSIVFIVLLEDRPYFGRFYAELLVGAMLFLFSIASLVKVSRLHFDFVRVQQSLSYSLPLVISSLAGLFLLSSDVLFINHFLGSEKAGLYSFALSVSMIVYVLISAINNAWLPFYYQSVNEAKLDEVRKTSKSNVKLVLSFSFLVSVFSEYAVMLMAPGEYHQAHFLIPVIILGFIFLFLSNLFVAYLMHSNKTFNVAIIITISAAVNMWLNYVLIPEYGYFVAAWTTLFSYFILFVLNFSNVFYYKATGYFPFSSSAKLFIIFSLLLALGVLISIPSVLGDIAFKMCLFLVLVYFCEFKSIELRRLKDRS